LKKRILQFAALYILFYLPVSTHAAVAKYAGDFLEIGVGARALGMGGTHIAISSDITSIYWNPAGLVHVKSLQLHGMHSERFAGTVNWDFIGVGLPAGKDAAMGLGFFRLGVDDIPFTALMDPTRPKYETYVDESGQIVTNVPYAYQYVNDQQMAFVFSYARRRGPDLSFGGNIKIIRKSNGVESAWGLGFDFGLRLHPYRQLDLGLVLKDATTTWVTWTTGRKELIVPQLHFGAAYPFRFSKFTFLPAIDAAVNFENRDTGSQLSVGSSGWDFSGGIEVDYSQSTAVRLGVDRGRFATGAGLRFKFIQADYGFLHHPDLGETHRISLTLFWDTGQPFDR